jgi:heme-degrading monooxygenase HmoA
VLSLSFWNTREDAEQYHRTEYEKIHETLRHLLDAEPVIRTFEVHTSTTPRIAAAKPPEALGWMLYQLPRPS